MTTRELMVVQDILADIHAHDFRRAVISFFYEPGSDINLFWAPPTDSPIDERIIFYLGVRNSVKVIHGRIHVDITLINEHQVLQKMHNIIYGIIEMMRELR